MRETGAPLPLMNRDRSKQKFGFDLNSRAFQNIIDHLLRDIDPRGRDAIAEFHRMVDLIDRQSIVRFKQVKRQQSPTDSPRGALTRLRA